MENALFGRTNFWVVAIDFVKIIFFLGSDNRNFYPKVYSNKYLATYSNYPERFANYIYTFLLLEY